jgi:hypothetical protein
MSGLFFCRTYLQTSCRCWVKTVRGLQFSHVSPCAYNKLYPKNVDVLPFKICTVFHSSESRNVMNESKRRTYERPLHQRVIDNLDAEKRVEAMKSSIADQPETDRFGTLSEGNHLDADEVSGTLAREWKRRERQKFLVKKRQNPDSLTEASWSETFGTLSNDVDEFLKMHTNVSGRYVWLLLKDIKLCVAYLQLMLVCIFQMHFFEVRDDNLLFRKETKSALSCMIIRIPP